MHRRDSVNQVEFKVLNSFEAFYLKFAQLFMIVYCFPCNRNFRPILVVCSAHLLEVYSPLLDIFKAQLDRFLKFILPFLCAQLFIQKNPSIDRSKRIMNYVFARKVFCCLLVALILFVFLRSTFFPRKV